MKHLLKNMLPSYIVMIIYFTVIYYLFQLYLFSYSPKVILSVELIILWICFIIYSFFTNPSKIAYAILLLIPVFFASNYRYLNEVQTNINHGELKTIAVKNLSYPYNDHILATPMPFILINGNKIIYNAELRTKPKTLIKVADKFLQGKQTNGEMMFYYKEQELTKPSSSLLFSLFSKKEQYAVLYKSTNKEGTKELMYDFESTLEHHMQNKAAYKKVIAMLFAISSLFCLLLFALNRGINFSSKKGLNYDC